MVCFLCGSSTDNGTTVQEGSFRYKQNMNNKLFMNYYCYPCLENPKNESKIFYDFHPHFSDEEVRMDWSESDEFRILGFED